jgi:hypothetical protein
MLEQPGAIPINRMETVNKIDKSPPTGGDSMSYKDHSYAMNTVNRPLRALTRKESRVRIPPGLRNSNPFSSEWLRM